MSAGTRGLNAEGPGDAIDLEKVWEDVKGTRDFSVLYQAAEKLLGPVDIILGAATSVIITKNIEVDVT